MRLAIISDTHNDHDMITVPECDILIHCGDACIKGNYTEAESFLWWFVKQPAKYKIIVPGNHDKRLKTSETLQQLAKNLGIIILRNEYLTINGIKFFGGTFVTKIHKNGTYRYPIETREAAWENYVEAPDILITHVPPRGVLDTNVKNVRCGCDILLHKIAQMPPKLHIFGHIHEHARENALFGTTQMFNCCNKDRNYDIIFTKPVIIDFPKDK